MAGWVSADDVDGGGVHVGEFLILAAHAPDEGVAGGADAGVDGPRRGEHGLAIAHDQVARLGGLAHEVEHGLAGRDVEVEIDLRAAQVRVRWHRVPDAAGLEAGDTHDELAGREGTGVDELAQRALVGVRALAEPVARDRGEWNVSRRVGGVGRIAQQVVARRRRRRNGGERDLPDPAPEIEGVEVLETEFSAVGPDDAGAAEVDDAGLAALEEVGRAQGLGVAEGQRDDTRADAADHRAIRFPPVEGDCARLEEVGEEELVAQVLGREATRDTGESGCVRLHADGQSETTSGHRQLRTTGRTRQPDRTVRVTPSRIFGVPNRRRR